MATDVSDLLTRWCDALLATQVAGTGQCALDGALLCPACQTIHGRCGELVYPLLTLADRTGEERYLLAARRLFDWSESLLCSDGSMRNDAQSMWSGITAFAAIALCDALRLHGHLLAPAERERWQLRLRAHGEWVLTHIDERFESNINYNAAAAGCLALLGDYFDDARYRAHARRMAEFSLAHTTTDGLLYGEGKPMDRLTPKGCRPVDLGYNVEESLPLLLLYAEHSGDRAAKRQVEALLKSHLAFLLPDGGWDNSFGTRNFKWTYWGSRTSEGSAWAYAKLGAADPACAAAAARNLEQMRRSMVRDLPAGGVHYRQAHAPACIHHAFSHARTLAALLDEGLAPADAAALPAESAPPLTYYPTLDTYRVHVGGWQATVTGYDFSYLPGGHATGGTLALLWHPQNGPMIASAMTRYHLYEAHNMQQLTDLALQGSATPRIEAAGLASCHDACAALHAERAQENAVVLTACGQLCREDGSAPEDAPQYRFGYRFLPQAVELTVTCTQDAQFVLPLAGGSVSPAAAYTRRVFCPAGRLCAVEHRWALHAGRPLCLTVLP